MCNTSVYYSCVKFFMGHTSIVYDHIVLSATFLQYHTKSLFKASCVKARQKVYTLNIVIFQNTAEVYPIRHQQICPICYLLFAFPLLLQWKCNHIAKNKSFIKVKGQKWRKLLNLFLQNCSNFNWGMCLLPGVSCFFFRKIPPFFLNDY